MMVDKKPLIVQEFFGNMEAVNAWYQVSNVAIINLWQASNGDIVVYYFDMSDS